MAMTLKYPDGVFSQVHVKNGRLIVMKQKLNSLIEFEASDVSHI